MKIFQHRIIRNLVLLVVSMLCSFCSSDDDDGSSRFVVGSIDGVFYRWADVQLTEGQTSYTIKSDCYLGRGVRIRFPKVPGTYIPGDSGILRMQMRLNSDYEFECNNIVDRQAETDYGYFTLNSTDNGILKGDFHFRTGNSYSTADFSISY